MWTCVKVNGYNKVLTEKKKKNTVTTSTTHGICLDDEPDGNKKTGMLLIPN